MLMVVSVRNAGGELVAPMKAKKAGDSAGSLQRRYVHVEVHPIDSLNLQGHMFG